MSEPAAAIWLEPGELRDGALRLDLEDRVGGDAARGLVPAYRFAMCVGIDAVRAGEISLRVGNPRSIVLYSGHVGYRVEPAHRGGRLAARALRLLYPLALSHGLDPLWITCNPDNTASRRTCELAGAHLVEIVDVPPGTNLHERGERRKCRYRVDLQGSGV